ncbi:MAG: S-layer homology domain-containing protein [Clostridia bacterium]
MKKYGILLFVLSLLLFSTSSYANTASGDVFTDVPQDSWAKEYIYTLKELNITNGQGNGLFGYDSSITRAEFLTFLVRTLNIDITAASKDDIEIFSDVKVNNWHYPYINLGLANSIIDAEEYAENEFEPDRKITREEMAIMIVRALQYDYLARLISNELDTVEFSDVKSSQGYIALAKDFGIINGRSTELFVPQGDARRQEAAAMLVRMHQVLNHKLQDLNGFYAIKASPQIDKINIFDSISFGWSRLEYNAETALVELSTDYAVNKDFWVPDGFERPITETEKSQAEKYIMVFATNDTKVNIGDQRIGLVSLLLSSEQSVQQVKNSIVDLVNNLKKDGFEADFDGVVIDFEALRNSEQDKQEYIEFLTILKQELGKKDKKLIVCVNPIRQIGQAYYDGYDFKSIGEIADKVILMAHDYEPKMLRQEDTNSFSPNTPTPLAPIKDVYYALRYAVNQDTGIPREKLLLQINFGSAQWNFIDGVVENTIPYTLSSYEVLRDKMSDGRLVDKQYQYSNNMQAPSFVFTDPETNTKKVIWYEDYRSVEAKIRLARLFGIEGMSVWRLGMIPTIEELPGQQPYHLNVLPLLEGISKR